LDEKKAIPRDIAIELCEKILSKNKKSHLWPLGIGKSMCWGCYRFGKKKTIENICALNHKDNRGCWQVNKRYEKLIFD